MKRLRPRHTQVIPEAKADGRPAILFVHGFYGSSLRAKNNGRRIFLTAREALFGRSALSLFQDELGTPPGPELEVEGLLGGVSIVPWLYEEDVYATLISRLSSAFPETQILPFAYDWRDDLLQAVKKLDAAVKKIRERGAPSLSLMAHSMGGIVATYYLAYGTQDPEQAGANWRGADLIDKVTYFGVPFRGTMITFHTFLNGSGLPQSKRLLPADTVSSFPSMYQMLPADGELFGAGKKIFRQHLFDHSFWDQHSLGLLQRTGIARSHLEARRRFTGSWLKNGALWSRHLRLEGAGSPSHLKVLNVMGHGRKTLDSGYLGTGLHSDLVFRDGDLTVTQASARAPEALKAREVRSQYEHAKLFLDPAVEKEYISFLSQ
ncbi:MAG TPA: hypothetical protein VIH99_14010 [Bdellovibrionota bacterium]